MVSILRSRLFKCTGSMARAQCVIRKRISRAKVLAYFGELPPCLVGIEACPSAHHWSRELQALGHTVRLMPPSYVKAYLKRSKNDANDAAAICEAVTRPSMRFVPIKTKEQQTALMLHRTRQLAGSSTHNVEATPYAGTWPNWASCPPRAAMGPGSCSGSLRMAQIIAFPSRQRHSRCAGTAV